MVGPISILRFPASSADAGAPATAALAVAPLGEIVAVAGQVGTKGSVALSTSEGVDEQVRDAFASLIAELSRAGLGWSDVLRFNTYLVGRTTLATFHEVRDEIFAQAYPDGVYPPNTTVLVAGLFDAQWRVEIDALAVRVPKEGGGRA